MVSHIEVSSMVSSTSYVPGDARKDDWDPLYLSGADSLE